MLVTFCGLILIASVLVSCATEQKVTGADLVWECGGKPTLGRNTANVVALQGGGTEIITHDISPREAIYLHPGETCKVSAQTY